MQIFLTTTIFKYEPINFLISLNKDDEVIKFLLLLYKIPVVVSEEEKMQMYENFILNERSKVKTGQNKVTFKQAILSPEYARASWVCFTLNCFN